MAARMIIRARTTVRTRTVVRGVTALFLTVLFFTVSLLAGCTKNGAVVITPLNTYSKEDITNRAEAYCRRYGMLPSEVRADENAWQRLVDDVIREYVYADLKQIHSEEINGVKEPEISEAEIRSKYETLLFSQKQYFDEKKEIVTAAIKNPRDTILYYPSGLKWVKYFIVPFEAEIRGRAAILLSEGRTEDYQKHMETAEAAMMPLIRELRQKLQNGFSFDSLAADYSGIIEDLLYDEDNEIFPAQMLALKNLKKTGDIAEYNIYQGHVFMLFDRVPDYIEVPYEEAREEIASSLLKNKTIIENDRLMKKLFEQAVADGRVKIRSKGIKEIGG